MKITCPSCNANYNVPDEKIPKKKAVATCKKCGDTIEIDPQHPEQLSTEVASEETRFPSARPSVPDSGDVTSDEAADTGVTDSDLSIFIVQNSEKYLSKFKKFNNGPDEKFSMTWHWPAFFTGIWWPLYRKLYLWAFITFIISFIPLVSFFWMITLGIMGNYIYYKHAKKKITELKSLQPSADLSIALAQAGGVNRWVITVVTVLIGIAVLGILAAIFIPMLTGGI